MAALLYLVPTPIGNLSDISDRCRQTLAEADFIAAEDTRVTRKLLNHLQLRTAPGELSRAQQGCRRAGDYRPHRPGADLRLGDRRRVPGDL